MELQLVPAKLFTAFNDVTFFDIPHEYFLDGKKLISVTTLIHQYQEEFQEDFWADIKGMQHGLTANQVKRAWRFINKKGTIKVQPYMIMPKICSKIRNLNILCRQY